MCCLMITTVWNVLMLRSNLIHHGGRWTRIISTTDNDCFEMPLLTWYMDMDEFVVCLKLFWLPCMIFLNCMIIFLPYPSLSPSSVYSLSLSLSLVKVSLYLSLFLSAKYFFLSLSLSLTSFFWLYTNLISISFVLWTSLYKDLYIFKQKFEKESMKCKLFISPMCKNQDG